MWLEEVGLDGLSVAMGSAGLGVQGYTEGGGGKLLPQLFLRNVFTFWISNKKRNLNYNVDMN